MKGNHLAKSVIYLSLFSISGMLISILDISMTIFQYKIGLDFLLFFSFITLFFIFILSLFSGITNLRTYLQYFQRNYERFSTGVKLIWYCFLVYVFLFLLFFIDFSFILIILISFVLFILVLTGILFMSYGLTKKRSRKFLYLFYIFGVIFCITNIAGMFLEVQAANNPIFLSVFYYRMYSRADIYASIVLKSTLFFTFLFYLLAIIYSPKTDKIKLMDLSLLKEMILDSFEGIYIPESPESTSEETSYEKEEGERTRFDEKEMDHVTEPRGPAEREFNPTREGIKYLIVFFGLGALLWFFDLLFLMIDETEGFIGSSGLMSGFVIIPAMIIVHVLATTKMSENKDEFSSSHQENFDMGRILLRVGTIMIILIPLLIFVVLRAVLLIFPLAFTCIWVGWSLLTFSLHDKKGGAMIIVSSLVGIFQVWFFTSLILDLIDIRAGEIFLFLFGWLGFLAYSLYLFALIRLYKNRWWKSASVIKKSLEFAKGPPSFSSSKDVEKRKIEKEVVSEQTRGNNIRRLKSGMKYLLVFFAGGTILSNFWILFDSAGEMFCFEIFFIGAIALIFSTALYLLFDIKGLYTPTQFERLKVGRNLVLSGLFLGLLSPVWNMIFSELLEDGGVLLLVVLGFIIFVTSLFFWKGWNIITDIFMPAEKKIVLRISLFFGVTHALSSAVITMVLWSDLDLLTGFFSPMIFKIYPTLVFGREEMLTSSLFPWILLPNILGTVAFISLVLSVIYVLRSIE